MKASFVQIKINILKYNILIINKFSPLYKIESAKNNKKTKFL